MRAPSTIGYLLKGYPRLSETFITNEILLLERLGFQIHIFALRNPNEPKIHDSVHQIKAPVTYISDYPWQFFEAFLKANLQLFGRKPKRYWRAFRWAVAESIRQRDSATFKRFVQAAYLVQNHLRLVQLDHLHAHFANDPTTVAFFVSWLTGVSYSFTGHAKDIYTQDVEQLQTKLAKAEFVATCTGFNLKHLRSLLTTDTPVHRIYHGTNLKQFDQSGANKPPSTTMPVILSVGRLVPKKGFPVLFQALKQLVDRGLQFVCFIVGTGPQEAALHKMVEELGLQQHVDLRGKMTQEELTQYYHRANVVALACQVQENGDRDGIPNILVEAMAAGTPVISTNISGIPELIKHEQTGLLVEPGDPIGLANGLQRLIEDRKLASSLTANAAEHVQRYFDMQTNAKQLGKLFERVLTKNQRKQGEAVESLPLVPSKSSKQASPLA
ncbi:MAG: glycosyltransferase family 4 protein [Chloroflexota bacterium]